MGGGNGAKAQHKREVATKNAPKEAKSQLKSNAAAQTIQCEICRQTFQGTAKQPILQQHVDAKHSNKPFATAFPKFVVA